MIHRLVSVPSKFSPKMESDSKRRKLNLPPRRGNKTVVSATENNAKGNSPEIAGSHIKLQQARNSAIAQAQQEGSTSNFRIIDSQFGNFLIPAVPSRAELNS